MPVTVWRAGAGKWVAKCSMRAGRDALRLQAGCGIFLRGREVGGVEAGSGVGGVEVASGPRLGCLGLRLTSPGDREEQGFQALCDECQEQGVTGADLVNLTGEELKAEFGIKKYAERRAIVTALDALLPQRSKAAGRSGEGEAKEVRNGSRTPRRSLGNACAAGSQPGKSETQPVRISDTQGGNDPDGDGASGTMRTVTESEDMGGKGVRSAMRRGSGAGSSGVGESGSQDVAPMEADAAMLGTSTPGAAEAGKDMPSVETLEKACGSLDTQRMESLVSKVGECQDKQRSVSRS
jgi:hypothetical protein